MSYNQVIVIKENGKLVCKSLNIKLINEDLVNIASKKYNKDIDVMRK